MPQSGGRGQPGPVIRNKWVHDSVVCVRGSHGSNDVLDEERSMFVSLSHGMALPLHRNRQITFLNPEDFGVGP